MQSHRDDPQDGVVKVWDGELQCQVPWAAFGELIWVENQGKSGKIHGMFDGNMNRKTDKGSK